eukprot:6441815-Prymnesium_polylepis.1
MPSPDCKVAWMERDDIARLAPCQPLLPAAAASCCCQPLQPTPSANPCCQPLLPTAAECTVGAPLSRAERCPAVPTPCRALPSHANPVPSAAMPTPC